MTRTRFCLTLPILLSSCLAEDEAGDQALSFRATDTTEQTEDARLVIDAWNAAFEKSFSRWQPLFERAGSDEGVEKLAAKWADAEGEDLNKKLGPVTPVPVPLPIPTEKWTPSEDAPADLNVCDRPKPGRPSFNQCSDARRKRISDAWDRAHYGVWRALQRIHWVLETPDDEVAALRWSREAAGSRSAPSTWFGPFSRPRAEAVRKTMEKAWAQLSMNEEIQINCWRPPTWWEVLVVPMKLQVYIKSPCTVKAAMAHTIWVGHPPLNPYVDDPAYEVCPSFFEVDMHANDERDLTYLGGVLVHEMLHFAVTSNCGGFPDSTCDSIGAVPAYRNFLKNDMGTMKDTFYADACHLETDNNKCYEVSEAEALAQESPNDAARSPTNYQYFARYTADMYRLGNCLEGMNKCFPTDLDDVGCDHLSCGAPPAGENCEPGTPGCGCVDVDPLGLGDLLEDGGYADGAGSFLTNAEDGQYCPGTDVVCGSVTTSACGAQPVCQTCNEDTLVGCSCDEDLDCQEVGLEDNLKCWGGRDAGWPQAPEGSGTCLPSDGTEQGRDALEGMPWFCLENCAAVEQWSGQTACVYNQDGYAFDHGTCMHVGTCESGALHPGTCEKDGLVCNGDDACTDECTTSQDCIDLQFPNDYECTSFGDVSACVPPICAGGEALGYCSLHAPQL